MAAVRTLSATWATTRGYTARLCSSTSSNASLCFITRKLALWSRAVASMELKHSTGSVPSPWLCGHRANFSTSATARAGSPFHFAFPVRNVEESRAFYGELLGCHEGRSKPGKWIDFSLGGNQIVCHWVGDDYKAPEFFNPMDGDEVPVPHFGLVVAEDEFNRLAKSATPRPRPCRANSGTECNALMSEIVLNQ